METRKQKSFSVARLGTNGRITIPAEYRRSLVLSDETEVALIQVGGALVIAPFDDAFSTVSQRLEARLRRSGSSVEDLIAAAAEARARIAREEFGVGSDE